MFASRYGSEVGITDWIQPQQEPDLGLDPKYMLWPEVLQQHGYTTGLVGKWHLGTPPQFHPPKNGFHYLINSESAAAKQAGADLNHQILQHMNRVADPALP